MKAVILAGGLGTRLAEETSRRPKPMVEVGPHPMLWHIMKIYGHHGVTDFVVCLGYKGYVVKEFFANYALHCSDVTFDLGSNSMEVHQSSAEPWRVTLVDTGLETQTGGRLARVRHHLGDGAFLMTYGDGLADVDVAASLEFHRSHGKAATVTAVTQPGRFGALEVEGDAVTRFTEKPKDAAWINGGFFVLEPRALDALEGDAVPFEQAPLRRLAAEGELACFRHRGFWMAMDTLRDKRQLDALWASGEAPWKVW